MTGIIKHVKHTERYQTLYIRIFQMLSSTTSILKVTGLVILKVFYKYSLRLSVCKLLQVRAQQGDNGLKQQYILSRSYSKTKAS